MNELHFVVQAFTLAAGACLFFSALVGTGVYVMSDLSVGIGPSHRIEVRQQGYSEREWLELLLDEYDRWTQSMRTINDTNALYLTVTQGLLAAALVFLGGATSLLTLPLQV